MKKFKQVDLLINIILIICFSILSVLNKDETIMIGYCVVGYWQLLSMMVHAQNKWFTEKWKARYIYHRISVISIITIPLGSVWILYFTAPFMALYYTWICYDERYIKMQQRPLALLK